MDVCTPEKNALYFQLLNEWSFVFLARALHIVEPGAGAGVRRTPYSALKFMCLHICAARRDMMFAMDS